MTTTQRAPRPNARERIITAAVVVATRRGLRQFSRVEVATEAEVAEATVSYHFGNMEKLRKEVVKYAIKHNVKAILTDVAADRDRKNLYHDLSSKMRQQLMAQIDS